ncbi:MAG: DNA gyrase C-terminal beta-propeller domain-containing protein, partial [Deltaproteobacteria bacterium]
GSSILTVTEKGFGKRTLEDEYRLQGRGGKGIITIKTTDRNGGVVGAVQVHDADHLMIITDKGMLIRMPAQGISVIGRNTQGVRLIGVDGEGEKVVGIARVAPEVPGAPDAPDGGPDDGGQGSLPPPAEPEDDSGDADA